MADQGLFIGFGFPVRGREEAATKVFGELLGMLGGQMQQGNVESFEPVFLQPAVSSAALYSRAAIGASWTQW